MIGIYTRISLDDGQGLGVARQEQDCRKLAAQRSWEVARVYTENNVSAYKKVARPEFKRMLRDLERGALTGLICYDMDRLARQPLDLERLISIFDQRSMVFATVQGELDLSTPDGRFTARMMVNFASKSSADTSRRIKRKHLELAQRGIPVGGSRPFGWCQDKRSLHPLEAKLIRQAADDLLTGVGLHTICRRWNEQGITTPKGNPWLHNVFKLVMLSPRLAGYRVYQGKIARDEAGNPVKGLHQPILSVEKWEAVAAMLTVNHGQRPASRRYLLSSLMRCGVCGAAMSGNADKRWTTHRYACRPITSGGGCGKVSISGEKSDELISKLVLRYLSEREITHAVEVWSREDELTETSERLSGLMAAYGEGTLSGEAVFPTVAKLERRLSELRSERTAWLKEQTLVATRPANITEAWPELSTEQRRSVIGSVLQAVVVKPVIHHSNQFDPRRIEVVWRSYL